MRIADSSIVLLTREIEQLGFEIEELRETKEVIFTKNNALKASLAIITDKIAVDRRVLNAPLLDESIFSVPEEEQQEQAGKANIGLGSSSS